MNTIRLIVSILLVIIVLDLLCVILTIYLKNKIILKLTWNISKVIFSLKCKLVTKSWNFVEPPLFTIFVEKFCLHLFRSCLLWSFLISFHPCNLPQFYGQKFLLQNTTIFLAFSMFNFFKNLSTIIFTTLAQIFNVQFHNTNLGKNSPNLTP